MKIAVASSDGTNISPHFGRSSYFLIFDVVNGRIVGKEQRPNTFTAHARGECRGEQTHDHGTHSHASVVEALSDCKAVLCYGMGWRAAEALGREGIQTLFLDGQLPPASQGFCRGHS
jgi:predicted Fe-Mo cluster-binding NifX family protein